MYAENFCFKEPSIWLEKYPNSVQFLNWNASRIGVFYNSYLLYGQKKNVKETVLIEGNSYLSLMSLTDKMNQAHTITVGQADYCVYDLLTPEELMEEYDEVEEVLGWTATKIGIFYWSKLLVGSSNGKGRSVMITRKSFLLLVEHAVEVIQQRGDHAKRIIAQTP